MLKKTCEFSLMVLGLSMAGMDAAWATGGCVNSPENPTLVLGLLGSAAAGLPWLRAQLGARRKGRQQAPSDQA